MTGLPLDISIKDKDDKRTLEQGAVLAIILGTMMIFVLNKVRYDVAGSVALVVAVLAGVVPADHTFARFGHAAVITVAAVLVISKALQNSGLVHRLVLILAGSRKTPTHQVIVGSGMAAALSCVMGNVGVPSEAV